MLTEIVTNVPYETFRNVIADKNLVIIYPTVSYRNLFLSYFLRMTDDRLLYYRLTRDNAKLREWIHDLRNVLPEARTRLFDEDIRTSKYTPAQLGEIIAEYVAVFQNETALYFDEIDRTPQDDDFREFMQSLLEHMPANLKVAINARRMNSFPWIEAINKEICAVLGTSNRKDNLPYTVTKDQKPQLEVYAFGQGLAMVNGVEIRSWDGALPRQMFYYFMDHHLVTRDEIFQVFWSQLGIKEATNVFHVTKRKIGEQLSRAVNDGNAHELTVYGSGFYTPNAKVERHYDVAEFEDSISRAQNTEDEEEYVRLYEHAIQLYRGDFLQTLDHAWVVKRRDHLRSQFVDALIAVARVHKRHQNYEKAITYLTRALREVPLREDVHRDLMAMYIATDRKVDAINQYHTLSKAMERALALAPSADTRAMYESISG